MQRAAHWLLPFWAIIAVAWAVLVSGGGGVALLPAFCTAEGWHALPPSASFDLALVTNALPLLALGWLVMVIAMMLPLALAPLGQVRERSFARRRTRSMLLFAFGFVVLWMAVGVILQALAWSVQWAVPGLLGVALAVAVAFVWQVSPAKQWCLNRCHQRPPMTAFGLTADLDALRFGVKNGAACAGACWALMLPMLLIGQGQLAAMIVVTLFGIAESLETPAPLAWRWRGGGKALRILAARWPVIPTFPARRYLPLLTKSRI